MMRRPLWLATGVVVGVGGTVWAQQRVRRIVHTTRERLSPDHLVKEAARSAQGLPARLRAANAAANRERRRRERELRARWQGQLTPMATPSAIGSTVHSRPGPPRRGRIRGER